MKAACLMLAVMMLATCVVAGTLAKYTTKSGDLEAKAKVAKWDIKAGEQTLDKLSLDDFQIYDTVDKSSKTKDTDVSDTDKFIAPGTWGLYYRRDYERRRCDC